MPTYGYDKNTDYQALIDQAVVNNNFALAAIYEAQRNEKIAGEGLDVAQTNQYASYLPGSSLGQGFVSPYQQQLNAAMANLGGSFQYDPEKDENYSAYRKQYLREAERTLQDTMGQYAAMTGGIPSSQAVAAASQASDNYKAQLADKIPEMRNQAYSEWLNGQNMNMNMAQFYLGASQQAENSYQNQISMAMSRWAQLGYADEYVANLLGVAVGTPTTDQSYQNWVMGQQEKQDASELVLMMLQNHMMPSDELLAAAGLSQEDAQRIFNASAPEVNTVLGDGTGDDTVQAIKDGVQAWVGEYLSSVIAGNTEAGTFTPLQLAELERLGIDWKEWKRMLAAAKGTSTEETKTGDADRYLKP